MNFSSLPHRMISEVANRQHHKTRLIIRTLSVLLFIGAAVFLYYNSQWIGVRSYKDYTPESITSASEDTDGNLYIITDSTRNIVKASSSRKLVSSLNASDGDYTSANRVIAGGDGELYIYDVVIDRGIRIDEERVLRMPKNLKYPEEVYRYEAGGSVRRSLIGIIPSEDGIRIIQKTDAGFTIKDENGGFVESKPLAEAESNVLFATIDPSTDVLYYVTFNGKVWRYEDGKNDTLLYDSDVAEGSVPQSVALWNGGLYVVDIGLRDLIRIDLSNLKVERFCQDLEFADRPTVVDLVAGPSGLILASEEYLTVFNDDGFSYLEDYELSVQLKVRVILVWAALIYIILAIIGLLFLTGSYLAKRSTVYARVAIYIVLGVLALVVLFLGTLFPEFKKQLTDQIYENEIFAASVTADSIPKDAFLSLNKPSDFMNEDYIAVRDAVHGVFSADRESSEGLYCTCYRVIDGVVTLTYTMEDICVIYPYNWEYEGTDMQELMETGKTFKYQTETATGSYIFVQYPIRDDNSEVIGFVEVGTDMLSVEAKNREILINLLINVIAMTVVVVLLVIELMHYMKGKQVYYEAKKHASGPVRLTPEIFRFITFLVFFFTNVTCVILPLHTMRIYDKHAVSWMTSAFAAALPVSAEVVAGAVFSALGGKVIKKLGPKKAILVSGLAYTIGFALRIIPSVTMLTIGSLVLGAGWGVLLIMVNCQIAELPEEEKDKGYAYYSISAVSGANCAIVLGGFLVQWVSYIALFAITAAGSIMLYFVCRRYLADNMPTEEAQGDEEEQPKSSAVAFIFKPRILGFFFLILSPLLICGYYLNYMFPIMGENYGLSETNTGYILMIGGVLAVVLGSPLTALFTKRNNRHFGLFISAILYAEAFLAIALMQNIPSLILAIFLIGVSNSFGVPLFTSYFTDLHEVEEFGYDRGFGVYSLIENGAQALGSPILALIYGLGVAKGMMVLTVSVTVFAVLFFITASIGYHRHKKNQTEAEESNG